MRAGKVARGGIRWSDRKEDFRTEILGLMKAQTVKNAVIVPVGSKGGFVVKRPPTARSAWVREQIGAEGVECYKILIRGLLDLTDNIVADGKRRASDRAAAAMSCATTATTPIWSSPPTRAPRPSPTSPTRIAEEYGFWLGDAFASGGSAGYDHKAMGITCARRLGTGQAPFPRARAARHPRGERVRTVVGVGDMSGDVFGNGMLLSRRMRLARRLRPPAYLCRSRPRSGASYRRAPAPVPTCRARAGPITTGR